MNKVREADIQRAIVAYLRPLKDAGRLNFYVNLEGARRDRRQQIQIKRDGVVPGRADLHFLLPDSASLLVELKRKPSGRLSPHQKHEMELNENLGHETAVIWAEDCVDGVNQVKQLLEERGVST